MNNMSICDNPVNKGMIATDIRALLEDMVKTGKLILHVENLTGEEILFTHGKFITGHYLLDFYTPEVIEAMSEEDKVGVYPLKLKKVKLDIAVKV